MTETKSYRYPGVQPFRTLDCDIFFGRENEIDKLFKLLMLEKLVVLFGKSGYGKSSLINAGIIPILKEHPKLRFQYQTIEVRIGKIAGIEESPVQKVISKINEQFSDLPEWSFLDKFPNIPSFWAQLKKKQSAGNNKFLLIFDQFEEFFNYSEKDQEIFRWELADLLYTDIPQTVLEHLPDINDNQYSLLSSPLNVKVLFSIRSDRLSMLHSMKDALPVILQTRFEIRGLRSDQARDAIIQPASKEDKKFSTLPFEYDEQAIDVILKELSVKHGNEAQSIEAFQLQILCQACEAKIDEITAKGITTLKIQKDDLPDFNNLYENYYQRQIETLPAELRSDAQTLLEEGLIYEDPQTQDCHRLSVDGNILRKQFGHSGSQINILGLLENSFLIRREINTVGGISYEISHDTILQPIIKIRNERKRQELLTKERELIRKQALEESAAKRKKTLFKFSVTLVLLLLLAWNWKSMYIYYLTLVQHSDKPAIRLGTKLDETVEQLADDQLDLVKRINHEVAFGSWEAAQMVAGLAGKLDDSIRNNFLQLTRSALEPAPCCWSEVKGQKDFRASGWIVSAIGALQLTNEYPCRITDFFVDNQLDDGSWSMLKIDRKMIKYGSTYATCHVLRALYNSLPYITDSMHRITIGRCIDKGAGWLLNNQSDSTKSLWNDYPRDTTYARLSLSLSLSGLALHTLNLIHRSTPAINRRWIRNLEKSQAAKTNITYRERSDLFYKLGNYGEADFRDVTRHLVIPWQIIAAVDIYKDLSFMERTKVNIWLDTVLEGLNSDDIRHQERFIRAEIYIGLRYLQDENYIFK